MNKKVEFFFDIVSPASYLAWTQVEKLADETGAKVIYRPFFLPAVFEKAGNTTPVTIPQKGKWLFEDLGRFAKRYGVPFKMNSRFPLNSLYAIRGLIAYQESGHIRQLGDGFYAAMWINDEDINNPEIVERIVRDAGIDPGEYQQRVSSPEVKQAVFDITDEAVKRGMFGAPTFFVGETLHWGQDRMDFVREALLA